MGPLSMNIRDLRYLVERAFAAGGDDDAIVTLRFGHRISRNLAQLLGILNVQNLMQTACFAQHL